MIERFKTCSRHGAYVEEFDECPICEASRRGKVHGSDLTSQQWREAERIYLERGDL